MAHLEDARRPSAQRSEDKNLRGRVNDLRGKLREVWPNLERRSSVVIVVAVLAIWEWQARAGDVSTTFFPAPSTIIHTFARFLASGELAAHLGATLSRLLRGFALGSVPGLIFGLTMGWSRRLRAVFDPLVAALHPIPKISLLPLIMIIFGIGETSKTVAVAVGTFFPMVINCMAGVLQISPTYFDVAKNYGAGPLQVFKRVILPGSLPLVLTGARISLNIALLITISTELVAAQEGLGAVIWLAWQTLRTEELYASLIVISALGIGFNLFLQRLKLRLVPWHEDLQND